MSSKKGYQDVRRYYVQSILPGYSGKVEQKNESSTSGKVVERIQQEGKTWKQKSIVVYVPVVITETNVSDSEHKYKISIPTNRNIFISPNSGKSQDVLGQVAHLDKETIRDTSGLHMVYGIPKAGSSALPPVVVDTMERAVTYIYGRVLGLVARAVERKLHFTGKGEELQETTQDDGQRDSIPPTLLDVGEPKEGARGTAVRRQVRAKRQAESSPILDDKNGKILGERPEDGEDQLGRIRYDTSKGEFTKG
jgi:predicted RNA-binding protein